MARVPWLFWLLIYYNFLYIFHVTQSCIQFLVKVYEQSFLWRFIIYHQNKVRSSFLQHGINSMIFYCNVLCSSDFNDQHSFSCPIVLNIFYWVGYDKYIFSNSVKQYGDDFYIFTVTCWSTLIMHQKMKEGK